MELQLIRNVIKIRFVTLFHGVQKSQQMSKVSSLGRTNIIIEWCAREIYISPLFYLDIVYLTTLDEY